MPRFGRAVLLAAVFVAAVFASLRLAHKDAGSTASALSRELREGSTPWHARRRAFEAARARDAGSVVFLGDSITAGWNTLERDFPGLKVANRGISGDTSLGLVWRLEADVMSLHPRAVVVLIGTNDLAGGSSVEEAASNIDHLVFFIQSLKPGTPVILCRVMPRGREPGKFPERIIALNSWIDRIAKARGAAVCDTFGPLAAADGTDRPGEFYDHLHPNAAGYEKWRRALSPIFKEIGLNSSTFPQ